MLEKFLMATVTGARAKLPSTTNAIRYSFQILVHCHRPTTA